MKEKKKSFFFFSFFLSSFVQEDPTKTGDVVAGTTSSFTLFVRIFAGLLDIRLARLVTRLDAPDPPRFCLIELESSSPSIFSQLSPTVVGLVANNRSDD